MHAWPGYARHACLIDDITHWPLSCLYCSLQTSSDGNKLIGFTAEWGADKSQSVGERTLEHAHKLAGLSFNRKKKHSEFYTLPLPSPPLHLSVHCISVSIAEGKICFFSGSRVYHQNVALSLLTYDSADAPWLACIRSERRHSSPSVSSAVGMPFKCRWHHRNLCQPHFLGSNLHCCKSACFNWVAWPIRERLGPLSANYDLF